MTLSEPNFPHRAKMEWLRPKWFLLNINVFCISWGPNLSWLTWSSPGFRQRSSSLPQGRPMERRERGMVSPIPHNSRLTDLSRGELNYYMSSTLRPSWILRKTCIEMFTKTGKTRGGRNKHRQHALKDVPTKISKEQTRTWTWPLGARVSPSKLNMQHCSCVRIEFEPLGRYFLNLIRKNRLIKIVLSRKDNMNSYSTPAKSCR